MTTPAICLSVDAPLAAYEQQADALLSGHQRGEAEALESLRNNLPQFRDPVITWKPLPISDEKIRSTPVTLEDVRLAIARQYSFRDWASLETLIAECARTDSPVRHFEFAADAIIGGNTASLGEILSAHSETVHARSTRMTWQNPPLHAATLLHYLSANGVENHRQRSPANADVIARQLLDAGAEVDALASMYGGEYATLSMLVSSSPPAQAGVQVTLVNTLLEYGAAVNGCGSVPFGSTILSALSSGFRDVAETLESRGASVDRLSVAAGLGRTDTARMLLPLADATERHAALALAAINNRVDVVRLLLDAGENPNRFNPDGMHSHQTPLHGAALRGQLALVQLLVSRGARTDIYDAVWQGTALDWARHGQQHAVIEWLEV